MTIKAAKAVQVAAGFGVDPDTLRRWGKAFTGSGPVALVAARSGPKGPVGVNVKLIDLSNANTTPVKGAGVKPLQRLLCVKDDGSAGPRTRAALIAAQQRLKLTPDVKFGPTTATALLAEN